MSNQPLLRLLTVLLVCLTLAPVGGCRSRSQKKFKACTSDDCYHTLASQIEYPQVKQCCSTSDDWAA
ncbi:MAG: hypothetical protein MI725_17075, partial [Pirellulales bacterium]|nr:hypothetical protein [Pirellulales bacterium]